MTLSYSEFYNKFGQSNFAGVKWCELSPCFIGCVVNIFLDKRYFNSIYFQNMLEATEYVAKSMPDYYVVDSTLDD